MKLNPLSKVGGYAREVKDFCVSDSQKHIKKRVREREREIAMRGFIQKPRRRRGGGEVVP